MMNKYLVVIPYIHNEAQGRELEFAVRGWFRHFHETFKLVVVGDVCPFVIANQDRIEFVPKSRVQDVPGQYRPHLDHVAKMLHVGRLFDTKFDGFIQAADDCYPVQDFHFSDVLLPKYFEPEIPECNEEEGFWHDMEKTRLRLQKLGLGNRNWETHCPRYYDFQRYYAVVNDHDLLHQSFVVENLYFNTYFKDADALHITPDSRYIQRLETLNTIPDPTRIWLSNGVYGWSRQLEAYLENHFGV